MMNRTDCKHTKPRPYACAWGEININKCYILPSTRRFLPLEKVYLRGYSAILNMKVILRKTTIKDSMVVCNFCRFKYHSEMRMLALHFTQWQVNKYIYIILYKYTCGIHIRQIYPILNKDFYISSYSQYNLQPNQA